MRGLLYNAKHRRPAQGKLRYPFFALSSCDASSTIGSKWSHSPIKESIRTSFMRSCRISGVKVITMVHHSPKYTRTTFGMKAGRIFLERRWSKLISRKNLCAFTCSQSSSVWPRRCFGFFCSISVRKSRMSSLKRWVTEAAKDDERDVRDWRVKSQRFV